MTATDMAPLQSTTSKRNVARSDNARPPPGRTTVLAKTLDSGSTAQSTVKSPERKRQSAKKGGEKPHYYDPIHAANQTTPKHAVEASRSRLLPPLAAKSSTERDITGAEPPREPQNPETALRPAPSFQDSTLSEPNTHHAEPHTRPWSTRPEVRPTQSLHGAAAESEAQSKTRKRPGPQAMYTTQAYPDTKTSPQPTHPQYWSPFTNTMGPPTYLPKYIRGGELQRRTSASQQNFPPPPPSTSTSAESRASVYPPTLTPVRQPRSHETAQSSSQTLPPILHGPAQSSQPSLDARYSMSQAPCAPVPASPRSQNELAQMPYRSPQLSPTSSGQPSQGSQRAPHHYQSVPLLTHHQRPPEPFVQGPGFPRHFSTGERHIPTPSYPTYAAPKEAPGPRSAPILPPYTYLSSAPTTPSFGPTYHREEQYPQRPEVSFQLPRDIRLEQVPSQYATSETQCDQRHERMHSHSHSQSHSLSSIELEKAQPQGLPGIQAMQSGSGPPPGPMPPTMQRHPGQRIGQQLLPATMDPNRHNQRYEYPQVTSATPVPSALPPPPATVEPPPPPLLQPPVEIHSRRPSREEKWTQSIPTTQHQHQVHWPPPPSAPPPPSGYQQTAWPGHGVLPPPHFQQQQQQQQQQHQQHRSPLPTQHQHQQQNHRQHQQQSHQPHEHYAHYAPGYMQQPTYPGATMLPPFQAYPIQPPQQPRRSRGTGGGRGSGRGGRRRRHSSPPVS